MPTPTGCAASQLDLNLNQLSGLLKQIAALRSISSESTTWDVVAEELLKQVQVRQYLRLVVTCHNIGPGAGGDRSWSSSKPMSTLRAGDLFCFADELAKYGPTEVELWRCEDDAKQDIMGIWGVTANSTKVSRPFISELPKVPK